MVSSESLLGRWCSPPEGHIDHYIGFLPAGVGTFKFVSISYTGQCDFAWRLSDSGDELVFHPVGPGIPDCYLVEIGTFGVRLEKDNGRDVLILKHWRDADSLVSGDRHIEFPAGWSEHFYYREK